MRYTSHSIPHSPQHPHTLTCTCTHILTHNFATSRFRPSLPVSLPSIHTRPRVHTSTPTPKISQPLASLSHSLSPSLILSLSPASTHAHVYTHHTYTQNLATPRFSLSLSLSLTHSLSLSPASTHAHVYTHHTYTQNLATPRFSLSL